MGPKFRKTGIDFIGDVPWGAHFCQFYQTQEDLIDILVPYFKAGLESNEFCMWVTSEPLGEKGAKEAMRKAVPNFDHYLKKGQIEIVPHTEWYLKDGAFRLQRVLNAWIDKLNQALAKGYEGLRLSGNTAWLEKKDWRNFTDYEEQVNKVIGKYQMIAICTYSLNRCGASELLDVVKNHQFALIKREGKWELIESSERRRAEKKYQQQKEFLGEVLESLPYPFYIIDAEDYTIKLANSAAGLGSISKNSTCYAFTHKRSQPCGGPEHPCPLEQVKKTKKPAVVEHIHYRKDGKARNIEVHSYPIFDNNGNVIQMIEYYLDITERNKAEVTLIRSERLKALGEMAAGVAHDFNNLLAIILGNAQLLEKGLKRYKMEEIKERLRTIGRTAYQGGETVRRLQHFTGRQVSIENFTRLDLNEIARLAISSTSPRWKDETEAKGITIKIKEKLEKLPPVLGSRSELMEVLTNLIFNSVEAMPDGGEITIRTEARENEVLLYFTDSGKGIPDSVKAKIFDPFFTTKGPKASGLGLSISYGVIKHHQGKIEVDSTGGKGTTFTIGIPIPLEVPLNKEKLKEIGKISSQKILVIDDEEGIRDVLGKVLRDEGHRVTLAKTGKEGLERFKQAHFDLVLTDLGMPKMFGRELAKKIKEINPDMLVGMITGWPVAIPKEKMKEEGIDFILSKPFDLAKVIREVNAVLKSKKDSY